MVTTQKVLEQMTSKQIVRELEAYLEAHFSSFSVERTRFIEAVDQLRNELDPTASPTVDDMLKAIDKQTASNLLFSGMLGFKSNLDHFIDPMARTVLEVDYPVFLREDTAMRLPEYIQAQMTIVAFLARLPQQHDELFEALIGYMSYLETTGPKLAHYFGYLLGNDILPNIVPGYHTDKVLTMQYGSMLADYLGIKVSDLAT